ncbi:M56 family metallopeptidase [Aquisphaera insulae]|uniref:M56 family metallopeptidase n=1 Tax=Aquisphaera insulae TaxID=2712864 RepID=UPI0013E9BD35|nr:M56 family metallopeptidase [Aquisphaera insulae]
MTHLAENWAVPWLVMLLGWSIRWGLVMAALAAWLAARPPRGAGIRYRLCLAALGAGLLMPFVPRWGKTVVRWPAPPAAVAAPATSMPPPAVPIQEAPKNSSPTPRGEMRSPSGLTVPEEPPAATASPAQAPVPTLDRLSLAGLIVATAWAVFAAGLLLRLTCGWIRLNRLKRDAREDDAATPLLDESRAALRLSRPVRVGVHPAVHSPVVVGGLRPVVLIPPDWEDDWTETRKRACLLHELSHLSRYDDAVKLAQELVRAVFFFHPFVLWLLTRLDRERELLCDEVAVAHGCDPVDYARLLFDLASRPFRLSPVAPLSSHGWLPFLDRRTVRSRIERLLEEDMPRTLSPTSPARRALIVGLALVTALGVGGLRVNRAPAQEPAKGKKAPAVEPARPVIKPPGTRETPRELKGTVLDPDDKPVSGATIVAGCYDPGHTGHQVLTTDDEGRFTWPVPEGVRFVMIAAHKPGLAASVLSAQANGFAHPDDLELRLKKPAIFAAVVQDPDGKPVHEATVRVRRMARPWDQGNSFGIGYSEVPSSVVDRSPMEGLFRIRTNALGSFSLNAIPPEAGLMLEATSHDGRPLRIRAKSAPEGPKRQMMDDQGFVTSPPGSWTRLVAVPASRITGRVISSVPDVRLTALKAAYQGSRPRQDVRRDVNAWGESSIDTEGRFTFENLDEGTVNVVVRGQDQGEGRTWTYRAGKDVKLTPGATTEVTIELIRGVEVEGKVAEQGTGLPIEGASLGVYGPFRPRTSAMTHGAKSDAQGRYHYRLPAGETYLYVMGMPPGYTNPTGNTTGVTVTIPEGVTEYKVPSLELAPAVTVQGKVLDAGGAPIAGATVVGTCQGGTCQPFPGTERITDFRGEFRLPPSLNNTIAVGKPAQLLIRLRDGAEHQAAALPSEDGTVIVNLPIRGSSKTSVEPPPDVAANELAGVVVDTNGKPLEGVEADVWSWYRGNEAKTDAKGIFRIRNLGKQSHSVQVVFRKQGYSPRMFMIQPVGSPGMVVVLGNRTYFEGRVTDAEGKPAANALIRANNGPKQGPGVLITEIWTETRTDGDGRYRLYAQSDAYDIQVRVPGLGSARLQGITIGPDEAKPLDIRLSRDVTFRARVVDSVSAKPVAGLRLHHWQHAGIEARSGEDGRIEIPDMLPGRFEFQVEAPGFTRWWSDQAESDWNRRSTDGPDGWQRNFDNLDFNIAAGMKPVTIVVERGVKITGKVLDPENQPVVGATVALVITSAGNQFTDASRFTVRSGDEGRFEVSLPASGDCDYNLMAHDGDYRIWRTWANGAIPPFRTKPGQEIRDAEIHLTRPAIVRGRVTDVAGQPIADREVFAIAADRLEDRNFNPAATTNQDGVYELKFVRPGMQFVHVSPIFYDANWTPDTGSQTLDLSAGETREGVDFQAAR